MAHSIQMAQLSNLSEPAQKAVQNGKPYKVTFYPVNPKYNDPIVEWHASAADYNLRASALGWYVDSVSYYGDYR